MSDQPNLKVARLRIPRGTDREAMVEEEFEVPFEPGASVLDGLMWIRTHLDASLAFRYSCISANVCKECVMQINGKSGYACTERLEEGLMEIRPLPNKRLLRDLACETVPPKERL